MYSVRTSAFAKVGGNQFFRSCELVCIMSSFWGVYVTLEPPYGIRAFHPSATLHPLTFFFFFQVLGGIIVRRTPNTFDTSGTQQSEGR